MKDCCYTYIQTSNIIGIIHKGESGYYKTDILESNGIKTHDEAQSFVDELNEKLNLTKGEVKAMEHGSMFGWETPAADPKNWNDDGTPKKTRPTVIIDFVGTLVSADVVTWKELNDINDSANDFLTYLGNYHWNDDPTIQYALFRSNDDCTKKYCVKLPVITMKLEAIVGGYGIIRILPEEFGRKRGFVESCYVILFQEDVCERLVYGEWELNENEFSTYAEAEEWCLEHAR